MKTRNLMTSSLVLLALSGCSYPEDPKSVALAVCEATKNIDTDTMQKYSTKAFARKLESQGAGFKIALKNKNPKALALKKEYAKISCEDLTVVEIEGRMMEIKSSSSMINGMKLKEIKHQWRIIE